MEPHSHVQIDSHTEKHAAKAQQKAFTKAHVCDEQHDAVRQEL
jgi:hypothetical protein